MRKYLLFISLILSAGFFLIEGCKEEQEEKGQVVFWNDIASQIGIVTIVMEDATSGNITRDYPSAPECNNAPGCFVYSNSPGIYDYFASEGDYDGDGHSDTTWTGSVIILPGGCTNLCLSKN